MRIKTVRDVIQMRQHTPINYSEIEHICPHDKDQMRMVELDQLPKQCKTEDIFRGKTFACIYCTRYVHNKPVAAHWILFSKRKGGIEVFDPLGHSLMALLNFIQSPHAEGMYHWARTTKYTERPVALQRDTSLQCGDWVGLRITMHQMTLREFGTFINSSHIDRESLVSLLTFLPLYRTRRTG